MRAMLIKMSGFGDMTPCRLGNEYSTKHLDEFTVCIVRVLQQQ
jgi:hypothetical protein